MTSHRRPVRRASVAAALVVLAAAALHSPRGTAALVSYAFTAENPVATSATLTGVAGRADDFAVLTGVLSFDTLAAIDSTGATRVNRRTGSIVLDQFDLTAFFPDSTLNPNFALTTFDDGVTDAFGLILSNTVGLDAISFGLEDSTGTALAGTDFDQPLVLPDFDFAGIVFAASLDPFVFVGFEITALTRLPTAIAAVPAPLAVIGLSLLPLLARRSAHRRRGST